LESSFWVMLIERRADIFARMRNEILQLEGFKSSNNSIVDAGLGPICQAFPKASFPLGCIHEFLSLRAENMAATSGFVAAVLGMLMAQQGTALWISASRKLFPPALVSFGIHPDRFIFIDLKRQTDVLWAMDEALKCSGLSAVIGEMNDISFTASRRLQLAVEQSNSTGFILRQSNHLHPTACVSRWKISALPSEVVDDLPGVGFPAWRVELLRIRNGKTGAWNIKWMDGKFYELKANEIESGSFNAITPVLKQKKAG
jgi:protein ImuA